MDNSTLAVIAVSTLVSEDLACVAAGALIAQGRIGIAGGLLACVIGIYVGDLLLFLAGRFAGDVILRWRPTRRFISHDRVDQASKWLAHRGPSLVFLSRFTPGLRLPTYFAAGLLRANFWRFAAYFLLASLVWTPFLIGLTIWLGDSVLRAVFTHNILTILPGALTMLLLWTVRRSLGKLRRWEFWPAWLAYLPVIPYLIFLAIKHRSVTLFTAANPGIPTGGFVGESKSQILDHLNTIEGAVPAYRLIPATLDPEARFRAALGFVERVKWPVVLKPDMGERGSGVSIVRSQVELRQAINSTAGDTIIQTYAEGPEFGIFYVRMPGAARGYISSITQKCFAHVTGDGISTIAHLIEADTRACNLANVYAESVRRNPADVPAYGERIQLSEIGSHCRGAIFLDGSRFKTAALENTIDTLAQAHPGFYFGRFDIRAESIEALRDGRTLQVIELNGVSAEATHVYDPSITIWQAYGVMFRQWRTAFSIGAANRDRGYEPTSITSLLVSSFSFCRRAKVVCAIQADRKPAARIAG